MPGKQVAHYVYVFVAEAKLQGGSTDLTTEETVSLSKFKSIDHSSEALVLPNNTFLAGRALPNKF